MFLKVSQSEKKKERVLGFRGEGFRGFPRVRFDACDMALASSHVPLLLV